MAFNKKTWLDRITEFPTRRTLTKSDQSTEVVEVARNEGDILQEGDAFSATNMNDLEQRIYDAINEIAQNVNYRWNPTTDYFEYYLNGEWHNYKKAGILWDGYIFDNGRYDQEHIGTWTAVASGGWTYGKSQSVNYVSQQTIKLVQSWSTQTQQDYKDVMSTYTREDYLPKGYDKVVVSVGSVQITNGTTYQANYNSNYSYVRVYKGVDVVATANLTANSTIVLDISANKEDNLQLKFIAFFNGPYVGGSPSTAYSGTVNIKSIQMLNND